MDHPNGILVVSASDLVGHGQFPLPGPSARL